MIAYLDNSATTKPSEAVVGAMAASMREGYYNPSSLYAPALAAEQALRACRKAVAEPLRIRPDGVFFTSGGTEANNLAILGAMAAQRGKPAAAMLMVEHPSVLSAYEELRAAGHEVLGIKVMADGQIDWADLEGALSKKPALLSAMQVNNETGAVTDIQRIREMIERISSRTLLHVDGVQGYLRVSFNAGMADLYTLSAHKLHGPKGVGAIYIRPGVRVIPRQVGGGQEQGLRSGTENTPGIAGLRRAVEELQSLGELEQVLRPKKLLLWKEIRKAVPSAMVNGPSPEDGAPHILNVSFPGVRGEVMLHALEGDGVLVSTGSACSSKKRKVSPVLLAMGIAPEMAECAIRFSLSPYTQDEEIEYAAERVGAQYGVLSRFWRR